MLVDTATPRLPFTSASGGRHSDTSLNVDTYVTYSFALGFCRR